MAINSGVSPERQGIVQGASQGLGVTQSALFQSNLITTPYFNSFERLCSRALTHLAKQIKIVWPEHAELYAPIIGDVGVDFLREHIDLDLDSFSVVVRSLPPMLTNRQTLDGLVMQAAASDPSLLPDALAVVMEPDLKQAVRKLQRKFAFRKYLETQQAQAQQERDTQLQQQLAEADAQRAAQERDNALALQGLKNEGNLAKTLATSKTKLAEQKIKALSG
jgi:DNA integrity scanning protein DisA with diadenylate cyclase activity